MRVRILLVSLLMFCFMLGQEVGKQEVVPDFKLNSLNGDSVMLSSYTQKKDVSFLVFFTTWCPWCTKQMETFQEMSGEVSSNVLFLAIGFESDSKKISNKISNLGVTYPVVLGNNAIAKYFNISGIPVTVVLDGQGNKLDQVVGFRPKEYFRTYLSK